MERKPPVHIQNENPKRETPKEEGKGQYHMLPKGLGNEAGSKPGVDQTNGSEPAKVWLPEGIKRRGDTDL